MNAYAVHQWVASDYPKGSSVLSCSLPNARALVVEDDASHRQLLQTMLKILGLDVKCAAVANCQVEK
jgi:hypothetical protein